MWYKNGFVSETKCYFLRKIILFWDVQNRPKSWPTGWTFRANHYLEIMFSKFSKVEIKLKTGSFRYLRAS